MTGSPHSLLESLVVLLPEVSLVAILDADKEGYLRSNRSLIQTIGRAARHIEGRVVMYADHVTASMRTAIDETERRRGIQDVPAGNIVSLDQVKAELGINE